MTSPVFAVGLYLGGVTINPVFTSNSAILENNPTLANTFSQVITSGQAGTPVRLPIRIPLTSLSGVTWFSDIRAPNSTTLTPPPMVGTGGDMQPVVRGYSTMQWKYNLLRSDEWYYLNYLWRLSRQTAGSVTGHMWIQWPDPVSGTTDVISARWDSITGETRNIGHFTNIQLSFTHLGINDLHYLHTQGIYYDTMQTIEGI